MKRLLVVDDDQVTRDLLLEVLNSEGFSVDQASSGEQALSKLRQGVYSVVLSDIRMAEMDGVALLKEVKSRAPTTSVILMTGFGNVDGAVEAIRLGAFDYVSKPFQIAELKTLVKRAFEQSQEQWNELQRSGKRARDVRPVSVINAKQLIGTSPKMVEVYKTIARAAMSDSTVLILGESGTGKELVARTIHEKSSRKNGKFVAVNCGAIAESLLESELYGHVKGAFTGASSAKKGLFEEADGGTLFLDEIGDLSLGLQVKLLRAIQEGEIKPVGSAVARQVHVRVVAATHRDLSAMVKEGKFREDLYYRLNVISTEMPSLRSRREDLPDLVSHFLATFSERNRKSISHVSDEAMKILMEYAWPGNVRELQNAIERAVALARTNILYPEDFQLERTRPSEVDSRTLESMEREHIVSVLEAEGGNKSRAAAKLGIDRATLYRKAQRFGINL